MNCDYCGLATGAEARWEVTTGNPPATGMTRYSCDTHLPAACGHVGQAGENVRVLEISRNCHQRRAA